MIERAVTANMIDNNYVKSSETVVYVSGEAADKAYQEVCAALRTLQLYGFINGYDMRIETEENTRAILKSY